MLRPEARLVVAAVRRSDAGTARRRPREHWFRAQRTPRKDGAISSHEVEGVRGRGWYSTTKLAHNMDTVERRDDRALSIETFTGLLPAGARQCRAMLTSGRPPNERVCSVYPRTHGRIPATAGDYRPEQWPARAVWRERDVALMLLFEPAYDGAPIACSAGGGWRRHRGPTSS